MLKTFASLLALGGLLLAGGCTDPTVIGGELVEDEGLPISFTDTLALEFGTVRLEAANAAGIQALSTGPAAVAAGAYFGCLRDSLFGETEARVGFELVLAEVRKDSLAELIDLPVDSAVLTVPLRPGFQIGDGTAPVNVRVLGAAPGTVDLAEPLTDDPLESTGVTLATASAAPPTDSSDVIRYSANGRAETVRVGPTLRIPLNTEAFTEAAIVPARRRFGPSEEDELTALDDTTYLEAFGGLILEGDPGADCSPVLPALNLFQENLRQLGVTVYVTLADGAVAEYRLVHRRAAAIGVANLRPTYTHDYGDSPAGDALAGGLPNGRAFAQGLQGLGVSVVLPTGDAELGSGSLAVNLAVLELPVVRDGFTEPATQLVPSVRDEADNLVPTTSAQGVSPFAPRPVGTLETVAPYGGATDSVEVYRLVLTNYLQGVIEGDLDPEIVLVPSLSAASAARTVVAVERDGGAGARLLLATTELP